MAERKKIIVSVSGASGSIYAQVLFAKLSKLSEYIADIGVLMSDNAKEVWQHELGNTDYERVPFKFYESHDFSAPFASGSTRYDTMIICPCSMGTMGRIAAGISNDLVGRAADVILKERRKLILVTRDTPLNLIQIRNMATITEAGGIICPASPSFYSNPTDFEGLAATVIDRVIDLAGIPHGTFRWNDKS